MKIPLLPEEHDWQLDANQDQVTFPVGTKIWSKAWRCAKCLSLVYLQQKPPARYHAKFHKDQLGKPIETMGCDELLVRAIHES